MWRKRKRMELVRPGDRRKQRFDDRSMEEIYLTRRMFMFKGLILAGFGSLAGKLFQMQILDATEYEGQAEENRERDEPIAAPRGMILDRNGAVLAENQASWTVSLTPALLPEDPEAYESIRHQVIQALDLPNMLLVSENGLPTGSEDDVLDDLAAAIEMNRDEVADRYAATGDHIIPMVDDVEDADLDHFREVERQLPGIMVANQFDYLARLHVGSASPVVLKEDVDRDVALLLEANKAHLPGVVVENDTFIRRYPAGPEFSHVLGYVGPITEEEYEAARTPGGQSLYLRNDSVGRGGLEQAMEEELRGRRGIRWVLKDARNVTIGELHDRRVDPTPGRNVVLSIDRDFQHAVTVALQEGIDAANAAAQEEEKEEVGSGVAIVMDPRNGEILAMVSLPTFDNQLFVDGISQQQYEEYVNDPFTPLTNFAVSGVYPPGSTIKPLYGCMGLQEQTISRTTTYTCHGTIRVPTVGSGDSSTQYVCWNRNGHGTVDLDDAIAESCNVYFYNVGAPAQTQEGSSEPLHYLNPGDNTPHYFEGLGIERMEAYLTEEFGFGEVTGIELANEATGVVPNPQWLFQSPLREYWSVGDTINVSIGQGHFSCTPLQLTSAIAALANHGRFYRPRLVRGTQVDEVIDEIEPEVTRELAFDPEIIETIRAAMRLTVTEGTAAGKFLRTGDGISIAGKTGTADFGEAVDGSYTKQHAWFCAFAPYEEPEIAVTVLLAGGGEGSTFAVPVADAILAAYFGTEESEDEGESVEGDDSDAPEEDTIDGDIDSPEGEGENQDNGQDGMQI